MFLISEETDFASTFLPEQFRDVKFSDVRQGKPEIERAVARVTQWVTDLHNGIVHPLIIYGDPGSGKTMLAACAWNAVAPCIGPRRKLSNALKAGTADNYYWIRCDKLPDILMSKEHLDNRTHDQVVEHLLTAYFAVLDDLDKCPATETFSSKLFGLIDDRLIQQRMPTIITMNGTPDGLCRRYGQDYGPQMVDRMERTGGVFIRMSKDASVKRIRMASKAVETEIKAANPPTI